MSKGRKKGPPLGNRLRTLRRYNGMTQREVAARLHLERSSYAYYEIGTNRTGSAYLERDRGLIPGIHRLFAGQRGVHDSDREYPLGARTGLSCCRRTE